MWRLTVIADTTSRFETGGVAEQVPVGPSSKLLSQRDTAIRGEGCGCGRADSREVILLTLDLGCSIRDPK